MTDSKERWRELAEQASQEKDPQRLLELTDEINRLLDLSEQASRHRTTPGERRKAS